MDDNEILRQLKRELEAIEKLRDPYKYIARRATPEGGFVDVPGVAENTRNLREQRARGSAPVRFLVECRGCRGTVDTDLAQRWARADEEYVFDGICCSGCSTVHTIRLTQGLVGGPRRGLAGGSNYQSSSG